MLIVFEGPEGAGKSTQLRLLADWLGQRGKDVVAVREPGGTVIGDEIRRLLLDPASDMVPRTEALLFMASRAQLVEKEIRPSLDRAAIVLVDRFFLSTYAYQGDGRGIAHADLQSANRMATNGLVPDHTLLLMLPPEEGLARAGRRGGHDRIERAELSFHERVAKAFDRFSGEEWQRSHPECGAIEIVDASGSQNDVFDRVLVALCKKWPGTFSSLSSEP